ncbi:MAG: cyclic nucleotide-binding protein [Pirellulaceae bacterium]|nr:cyclic nucleotide-binding protein [Pirellulaceae bacterium]
MYRVFLFVAAISITATASGQDTASRWFDQLQKVNPNQHAVAGQWQKSSEGLRTDAATSSRIIVPAKVPRQYDLRVEFTRHSGQHSVAIFFTCGVGRATYELDAWGEHLAGIQQIDGGDIRSNSTRTDNLRLENGRRYTAEIHVRRDRVDVLLNQKRLATYRGDGSDLSILPVWQIPASASLAVGAYQAETTFHKVELRAVTGEQVVNETSSVAMTPMPKQTSPATVVVPTAARPTDTRTAKRVLIVIADHHFFYREYADPRQELERAGFTVEVAAGNRNECYPHGNSGQGNDGGGVLPDFALSQVDPDRYEAIVFSGGWGASMYQYAFDGRYDDAAYNGDRQKKNAANRLINAFHKQDKYICGICNGVSVLAWSRVDGQSLLSGKRVTAPTRAAPSGIYDGQRGNPSIRWHVEKNGGRLVPAGSIGNPRSRADDVAVDGKIITAEDDQSAREAGRQLARLLK